MISSFVPLYQDVSRLRHLTRFQRHVLVRPQTVAEHSLLVAMIADHLVGTLPGFLGIDTLRLTVVRTAVWHDAEECYTSDIPHDVKKSLAESGAGFALSFIESEATFKLSEQLASPQAPDGPFAARSQPLVKLIVKMADWFELLAYVASERALGNRDLDRPAHRIWDLFSGGLRPSVIALDDELILQWYDRTLMINQPYLGRLDEVMS